MYGDSYVEEAQRLCREYGHLWNPPLMDAEGDVGECMRCGTTRMLVAGEVYEQPDADLNETAAFIRIAEAWVYQRALAHARRNLVRQRLGRLRETWPVWQVWLIGTVVGLTGVVLLLMAVSSS